MLLQEGADVLETRLNHPDHIYNLDESAFFLNEQGGVVFCEKGKAVSEIGSHSDKENLTISICVSATGKVVKPLVVYKYERTPTLVREKLPKGWAIGASDSGWMNSELFCEWFMNPFAPFEKAEHGDEPVIVFFDGHASHLSLPVSQFAKENKIHLICLPRNCTHLLQPLDVSLFRPLNRWWKVEKELHEFTNGPICKWEVPILLKVIFERYDLAKSVISGFQKCGLHPWNAEAVDYSKCKNELSNQNPSECSSTEPIKQSVLQYLESKIEPSVLHQFQNVMDWTGDDKYAELFNVWKKMANDKTSYCSIANDSSTCIVDVPVIHFPQEVRFSLPC